jgi:hypothetical protein
LRIPLLSINIQTLGFFALGEGLDILEMEHLMACWHSAVGLNGHSQIQRDPQKGGALTEQIGEKALRDAQTIS